MDRSEFLHQRGYSTCITIGPRELTDEYLGRFVTIARYHGPLFRIVPNFPSLGGVLWSFVFVHRLHLCMHK